MDDSKEEEQKGEMTKMNRSGEDDGWGGCGNERAGERKGDVADFSPGGRSKQRNPQVQRGTAGPAPVPGRPSLL